MEYITFILIILGAEITRYSSYGGVIRIRESKSSHLIISNTNYLTATTTNGKENDLYK